MKAIVYHQYGSPSVLGLREAEEPTPRADEVLVKVRAASVNPADWHLLRGEPYVARLQLGLRKPKVRVLGCDVAGQIEAVGETVEMLRAGDDVFGSPFMHGFGVFAEYVCVSEDLLAPKPANLSFEELLPRPWPPQRPCRGCAITEGSRQGKRF
jgi:NADPH:quinone reductase-like Zn-dependent oxidoreductase